MKRTSGVLPFFLLLMLPGCGRIIDWGKSNFNQGEDVIDFASQVSPYIRSVTIYNQLETKAIFDVLWLTDEVREIYADLHIMRQGKSKEKLNAVLRRQLEENNHYISFYILSTHDVKLGVPESHWSFFLQAGGVQYHPVEIKEIELPYEYQIFFGPRWNRFKVPYLIRFRAHNLKDQEIVTDETPQVSLVARSAEKEHSFVWRLQPEPEMPPKIPTKKRRKSTPKVYVPRKRIRK